PTQSPTDGPANVAIDELFFLDSTTLIAVTHGRGMVKTTVTTTPGNLSGHVSNPVGNAPIANVTISLNPTTLSVTTDSNGFYTLSVPPGTYKVMVLEAEFVG